MMARRIERYLHKVSPLVDIYSRYLLKYIYGASPGVGVSGVEQELGLGVDGGQLAVEEGHGLPHPGGVASLCG